MVKHSRRERKKQQSTAMADTQNHSSGDFSVESPKREVEVGVKNPVPVGGERGLKMLEEEIFLMKKDLQDLARERAEAEERSQKALAEVERRWARAAAEEGEKRSVLIEENALLKRVLKDLAGDREITQIALEGMESKNAETKEEVARLKRELQNAKAEMEFNFKEKYNQSAAMNTAILRLNAELRNLAGAGALAEETSRRALAWMDSKVERAEEEIKSVAERLCRLLLDLQQACKFYSMQTREVSSMRGRIVRLEQEEEATKNTMTELE